MKPCVRCEHQPARLLDSQDTAPPTTCTVAVHHTLAPYLAVTVSLLEWEGVKGGAREG